MIGSGKWKMSFMRKNKHPHSKGYAAVKAETSAFRQQCAQTLREWDMNKWTTTTPWTGCREHLIGLARTAGYTDTKAYIQSLIDKDLVYMDSIGFYVIAEQLQAQIIEVWSHRSYLDSFHPRIFRNPGRQYMIILYNGVNHWEVLSLNSRTLFDENSDIVRTYLQLESGVGVDRSNVTDPEAPI